MKRIVIVAQGLSDGGAERVAALLANRFSADGNCVLFVAVYSPEKEYVLRQDISYRYIRSHHRNKAFKLLERSWKLQQEIRDFQADVVISFLIKDMLLIGMQKTVPVIYSLRNDPQNMFQNRIYKQICFALYKRAKAIVFQTPGARDYFPEEIRRKGVVIGNPLTENLPLWDPQNYQKRIITACRLTEQKNIPMLIRGFSVFHKQYPEYRLAIYGKGALQEQLEQFVNELGITEAVFFPGHSEEIHHIMAHSFAFALTSNYEGLSNSMLEALAIGVPTVCTDCPPGGAAQYIQSGVNGMLVSVGDAEALAKCFCQMAEAPELCVQMSEEARKIQEQLDMETIFQQWQAVLKE